MSHWAVVVPSNRPDRLATFEKNWRRLFDKHQIRLIVVRDEPATWEQMPDWIPRRSDMIRSWGFIEAFRTGVDYVLTLDDDTLPSLDPFDAYEAVFETGAPWSPYLSVGALTTSGLEMRGFPYADRAPATVAVQYGGWNGVLDYDAATQMACPKGEESFRTVVMPVPYGVPTTCCIMNCAFRREHTPIMWQLPLVDGLFNRWGDIWSGLFQKKALDAAGDVMVINGKARVHHERASDPVANLEREQPGVGINETLWTQLDTGGATGLVEAWVNVTDSFAVLHSDPYRSRFLSARDAWLKEVT